MLNIIKYRIKTIPYKLYIYIYISIYVKFSYYGKETNMGIEYIDYIPFQGDANAKEVGMQDFASKAFIYLKLI